MFSKILIANRGEIACRVIKTARQIGVQTVAVYSDADAEALHVKQADEAVRLGPPPVAESYLRGDLIIQAALATGAEAIHPGYGFLSENPDFVEAVAQAGLVFIGPSAKAIRAMGLKDAAKALMQNAGVPVVPGYHGAEQGAEFLAEKAEQIGYPVLIKAVAGGGGKGMRLVERASDFAENLASAQAEAQTAFGNPAVLIEKYVTAPRHIEVQVFGDGKDAVHLFERDCSLQRRHQKVIEEAPAPGMTAEMRAAMGEAAVKAAKAIGYSGAGTVEFVVDGSGPLRVDGFWFMEMNTRLQVEHPVTEAITGVDLVAWQLQIAAGHDLPKRQEELQIRGHAIEARLYAEDVPAGFLPATGRLTHLRFGKGVRIDSGVESGDEISAWYDPMIAKVTAFGADRSTAISHLRGGLLGTEIAGVTTNRDFLVRATENEAFLTGRVDTGLIARHQSELCGTAEPMARDWAIAAASSLEVDGIAHAGFTLWAPMCRRLELRQGNATKEVEISVLGPREVAVVVDGERLSLMRKGHGFGRPFARSQQQITLFGPHTQVFEIVAPGQATAERSTGDAVIAPMPGIVTQVRVSVGDHVAAGDRIAVMEAMKMEHVLRAPRAGEIANIAVAQGDHVEAGAVMVSLVAQD